MTSRLLTPPGSLEKKPRRVAMHNARRVGDGVLMTNEAGEHAWLASKDYERYLSGAVTDDETLGQELARKDFVRDRLDFRNLTERAVARHLLDWPGPNVHTMVVTKRCNFKCTYCHASVVGADAEGLDMTVDTARKAVDLIFQSPNPSLMIEFQGGEPLLNWPVIQFIVDYAELKNTHAKKNLHFGLISNFSLLDGAKIDWCASRGVSFCTSLDGPADLHNKNRLYLGGNSHEQVVARIGEIMERRKAGAKLDAPNAICTVTRHSLGREREIVDQIVGLGLERIQLGPLDPIGFARRSWDTIGYTSREFVDFYARALDRVIELNQEGKKCYEKMALIFLIRILEGGHWRFPNADGLARLAYDWDGSVYVSEDGRLLAADGDPFFKIGAVGQSSYQDIIDHPTVRVGLIAANSLTQPQCAQCAYNPFCTVMPVNNYASQGSLWGRMPENAWCEKMMGIFDVLFERLRRPASRAVLESWLQYKDR
jgi:uncharacterized protein